MSASCPRPNYFLGAPPVDGPSQKVLVAEKLATTCAIDAYRPFQAGEPGGVIYLSDQTLNWAATPAGSTGQFLTSNGLGAPYWSNFCSGDPDLDLENLIVNGTFTLNGVTQNAILFVGPGGVATQDTNFLWNNTTQNLQPGTVGVSIGKSAGVGTNSVSLGELAGAVSQGASAVAIGLSAGQFTQGDAAVAMGVTAGQVMQGASAVAIGVQAGQTWQGTAAVAIGVSAGAQSQGVNAIAMGVSAGQTAQGMNAVAIGVSAGAQSQGVQAIALGTQAGQTMQGTNAIAIGTQAGSFSQSPGAVAIGLQAGQTSQGLNAVAIGVRAGQFSQADQAVAIGEGAGQTMQGLRAVAIGVGAGQMSQGTLAVAIGVGAGQTSQGIAAVAVGNLAGNYSQGTLAVAVGNQAGQTAQGISAVAIGNMAGNISQGTLAVAIGNGAGQFSQGSGAVAVGTSAGQTLQGQNAIAIGNLAGNDSQAAGSIILNATGVALNCTQAGFFVAPVRNVALGAGANVMTVLAGGEVTSNSGKTFVIDHPLKPKTHYLVHACLEGPEAGVYYRGNSKILQGEIETLVQLPDYVAALATDFTIHITALNHFETLVAGPVQTPQNQFVVRCGDSAKTELGFSWFVYGKRHDIETEVLKADYDVQGEGPYLWLAKKTQ